jgi:eukaryotic translation initiation factor 2C
LIASQFQGTAKATEYQVLVDEMSMSTDEVQAMIMALCYEHQINTGATSLPEPVYQADEWAKRGLANFVQFR